MTRDTWQQISAQLNERPLRPITLGLFTADLAVIAASWYLHASEEALPLEVLAALLLLLGFIHVYMILHEAIHGVVAKRGWVNNLVGHLCGWLIFLPFLPRQRNHLQHHRWAAHPKHDPENSKMIERFSVITRKQELALEFMWRNWLPLIALNHIIATWWAPFGQLRAGSGTGRHVKEARFAGLYLVGYAALACLGSGRLLEFLAWYAPPWFLFLCFMELVNLPHHAEAPLLDPDSDALPYWRQDEVSHNCAPLPIWSSWLILHFNMHVAHHRFPSIPWYDLPRAQALSRTPLTSDPTSFKNEFGWALERRRRPLLKLMGHFFDKRVARSAQ